MDFRIRGSRDGVRRMEQIWKSGKQKDQGVRGACCWELLEPLAGGLKSLNTSGCSALQGGSRKRFQSFCCLKGRNRSQTTAAPEKPFHTLPDAGPELLSASTNHSSSPPCGYLPLQPVCPVPSVTPLLTDASCSGAWPHSSPALLPQAGCSCGGTIAVVLLVERSSCCYVSGAELLAAGPRTEATLR